METGMKSNILVVEDDPEMLASLKESLEIGDASLSVATAGDGVAAMQQLASRPVNLVVTDYRMPRMDGLSLMAEIKKFFPDIPVIFVTGHNTPEAEFMAINTGAIGYVEKPDQIKDLIAKITASISNQSDGGTLHNVSAATFLQLIKMEEQVCTIRLTERNTNKQGILFFKDGNLLDARFNKFRGEDAAYEIFSWDNVSLQIQNSCPIEEPKIQKGLQAILMDAMLLKDERKQKQAETAAQQAATPKPQAAKSAPKNTPVSQAPAQKHTIADALGNQVGVENIFQDTSWKAKLSNFSRLGTLFESGKLKVAYIVKNDNDRYLLLPEKDYTVIVVNSKCHRDQMMDNLARLT
jgi:CheY-like chemotaxis protein